MSNSTLYISRRCKFCQELLILIHKNKKYVGKLFKIVDIDTMSFPRYVEHVPLLNYNGNLVGGHDINKQINLYLSEVVPSNMPPIENSHMPKMSSDKDIYSNKHNPTNNNDNDSIIHNKKSDEYDNTIGELDTYCENGTCSISFSSIDGNENTNTLIYDSVEFGSDDVGSSNINVNSDHGSLDNTYEKFLNERNEGIDNGSPQGKTAIDFSLNSNNTGTLDLRV